jgi:hypothetical protein
MIQKTLFILLVIVLVFLGSLIFSINFLKLRMNNFEKKYIEKLSEIPADYNIEKFGADTYGSDEETIKAHVIEQVNKIYDIDVDAIRNLGAISKSLLTGKNYHKNTAGTGEPGILTIPANVVIEGTLTVTGPLTAKDTLDVTGALTTKSTLSVTDGPLITGSPNKYQIGKGDNSLELVVFGNSNSPSQIRVGTIQTDLLYFGSRIAGGGEAGPALIKSTSLNITKKEILCGNRNGKLTGYSKIQFCLDYPDHHTTGKKNSQFQIWNGPRQMMGIDTETENILYIRTDAEKKQAGYKRPPNKSRGARIAFGTNVDLSMATDDQKGQPALTILTKPEKDNDHPLVILDNTVLRHNHIHMNSGHAEEKLQSEEDNPFDNNVQWKNKINTQTLHIPDNADIKHSIYVKGRGKTSWWKNKDKTIY